jgi:LmbE family N-acetylglucosaminyl deacetylase
MEQLKFTEDTNILIVSVHPDDEAISSAGILQRAVKSGANIKIIFVTNGNNNHICQRITEKKLFISKYDKMILGEKREQEALLALKLIGIIYAKYHPKVQKKVIDLLLNKI